ncbi:haloacid dehalogenase type II [Flammeovirga aprica]|uniref:Haloacid dehalogenase type II n=1 Tax=Flammeovirga aprica JL-4 TaxID=694437 RepID=A0A7X9XBJ0_9BACT|nr:haloacid dehalogenase type II [Flammeovirga aprica]NME70723.1 haloacid dehalogenase type II [Flammeovirga aprica JL-4]
MEIKERPKVLFFDINETILDLTRMKKQVGDVLNGRSDLLSLWFTTLLHHTLVTSASGQYENFDNIGAATLQMVGANNGIEISEKEAREVIVNSLQNLPAHPEVKGALTQLKEKDYKLVAFTNSSIDGIHNQLNNSGLTEYFDEKFSMEEIQKFKPFTQTYDWGAKKMGIKPNEAMLIAAHGWDVAGAMWAGWRAAFISRKGQQIFPLGPKTEIVEPDLQKVANILIQYK